MAPRAAASSVLARATRQAALKASGGGVPEVAALAPRAAALGVRSMTRTSGLMQQAALTSERSDPPEQEGAQREASGTSTTTAPHFKQAVCNVMANPVYSTEELTRVEPQHREPRGFRETFANRLVNTARTLFDYFTNYGYGKMNETNWLTRFLFLESVAGVPGLVGGACRHLRSLRLMKQDNGWINSFLQEAENERMHLMTFMQMRAGTGILMRLNVFLAQGVFFNLFFFSYLLSPSTCHSFVGYLEEEAVKTYTHAIEDLDAGKLPQWQSERAPQIAIEYWRMPQDAKVRDLLLNVRADEAHHSHVNHTASLCDQDSHNPFLGKELSVPKNFVDPPEGFKP